MGSGKVHELKTHPESYSAVLMGSKTHEIRVNDRGFEDGDLLALHEWLPKRKQYTGRAILVAVTHVTPAGRWGLPDHLCVMSVRFIANTTCASRGHWGGADG